MRRPLILALIACTAIGLTVRGSETVDAVLRVGEMLRTDTWTRTIWIENREAGRDSRYPARFPALVFALQGMLWMYTPIDGTQSLSQYRGRLTSDQNNLDPLLAAVEPGLRVLSALDPTAANALDAAMPFACLPKCVARWFELRNGPTPPDDARILSYYLPSRTGQKGHTVLEYSVGAQRFVYDPDRPEEVVIFGAKPMDPLRLVQELASQRSMRAPSKVMALTLAPPETRGAGEPRIAVRREPSAGSNRSTFMR